MKAEQNELLPQLKEKGNRLIGEFQRKEKEIRGEFDENSPRVTMNDVENIISESDTYQEIMNKLQMIQKYPDFIGGSGMILEITYNGGILVYILLSHNDEKDIDIRTDDVKEYIASSATPVSAAEPVKGDANCDGDVNMSDAVIIMQSLANPAKYGVNGKDEHHISEQGKINGDIAGDNDGITNADALAIQKKLLNLE